MMKDMMKVMMKERKEMILGMMMMMDQVITHVGAGDKPHFPPTPSDRHIQTPESRPTSSLKPSVRSTTPSRWSMHSSDVAGSTMRTAEAVSSISSPPESVITGRTVASPSEASVSSAEQ